MEYIYAAMLLHKAGKDITESALKSVLSSAGVEVDEGRCKATASALKDVNIEEAISKASVAPVAAAAPAGAAAESPAEEAKPEKKKEAPEAASEEAASAGLGALFG